MTQFDRLLSPCFPEPLILVYSVAAIGYIDSRLASQIF